LKDVIEPAGSIEIDGDQATVVFERRYASPRERVWRALTDPHELSTWMDPAIVELRVGGRFEITFGDGKMLGHITKLIPEQVLAYTWNEDQADASEVRWELASDGAGTNLRLTHTRLARRTASAYGAGWHLHLEMLAAVLAGMNPEWDDARFDQLREGYAGHLGSDDD
jgi:uncharacterized protein YndB with AHSA1/START domain